MLCFRCQHRANYLDDKLNRNSFERRPRWECGEIEDSKANCYMYRPIQPIKVKKAANDTRDLTFGILSARFTVDGVDEDFEMVARKNTDGSVTPFWRPKRKKHVKQKGKNKDKM